MTFDRLAWLEFEYLSLGAGVQSTAIALLAEEGVIPKPDVAIFADTGWEPTEVYEHLERLESALSFPVIRVQVGNIRDDTLAGKGMILPVFVKGHDGQASMLNRQCTVTYKVVPIRRYVRKRLGARSSSDGRILSPPNGHRAGQWIGFSVDEVARVNDSGLPPYLSNRYPLLDLHMSRTNCIAYLESRGWPDVPKSACVGCPFHGNRMWREMRDHDPESFADAVRFDKQMRERGWRAREDPYLHRSLQPLDEAPIEKRQRKDELAGRGDLFDFLDPRTTAGIDFDPEDGAINGCSPHGCRVGTEDTNGDEAA
jgi:hypothetical protein